MRSPLRSIVAVVATAVLVLAAQGTLFAAAAKDPQPINVIVGFEPGDGINGLLISASGGTTMRASTALGLAGVHAANVSAFADAILGNPGVSFVETNDRIYAAATGWDATGWDATGWDATGWDATGWDATGWDATGWDATGWDATGWDATGWDATGWDATGWDGTGWDATGWDGSLWDQGWLTTRANESAPGSDPLRPQQWGWHTVDAAEAALRASGAGQTICVLDSGIDYTHPDLAGAMWTSSTGLHGRDLVNGDDDPMDDAGHGTHVAGIAAALSANGAGMAGASAARLMAVKVLDAQGAGREFDLALGIDFCVANGAKILSMSLSTPDASPAVQRALQRAHQTGAVLVAAAGNTGDVQERYPASYGHVIGVGALLPDGHPAPFSTRGPSVDVAAPGYAVVGTLPHGGYGAFNGTSMAVPFVSATAAMMLDANPALTPADVARILAETAMDLGPAGWDEHVGAGFLQADAAVGAA